jgi:TRAP-type C4-dicarboxylate transport system permease small subunit
MSELLGRIVKILSGTMHVLSGVACVGIVIITCFDVVARRIGLPVDFPFEVVCALAGVLVALALPAASRTGAHVTVDYLKSKITPSRFRIAYVVSRCMGIAIFLIISWKSIWLAKHLFESNEHSPVMEIPQFIFPYFLAAGCIVTCLVLFHQMLQGLKEKQE